MTTVSIVMPAYNAMRHITECLDSVLTQNYDDFEVIVVNDGSSDETLAVCQDYARRDARVRVIDQPNAGAARARNRGVAEADGEFVSFVDVDDVVHPHMVGRLVETARRCGADIVSMRFTAFEDVYVPGVLGDEPRVLTSRVARSELLYQRLVNGPCAKLFRKEVLGAASFVADTRVGEDLLMNLDAFARARTIVATEDEVYGYRQHDDSTMHSVHREDRMRLVTEIEARREEELSAAFDNRLCAEALYMVFEASTAAERQSALALMKQYRRVVLSDAQSLPQLRIYAAASYAGAWLPAAIHEWKAQGAHR